MPTWTIWTTWIWTTWTIAAGAAEPAPGPAAPEALYVEHCATCHGKTGHATFPGVMMGAGSFASAGFWQDRPPERWRRAVAEGGPAVGLKKAMPAFGDRLTPEQIDQVLAIATSFRPVSRGAPRSRPAAAAGS